LYSTSKVPSVTVLVADEVKFLTTILNVPLILVSVLEIIVIEPDSAL
jgi:hypothetical protein